MSLLFPSLDCLRLALTSAAVPPEVADTPAVAVLEPDGSVRVRPSKSLPRSARAALSRIWASTSAGRPRAATGPARPSPAGPSSSR